MLIKDELADIEDMVEWMSEGSERADESMGSPSSLCCSLGHEVEMAQKSEGGIPSVWHLDGFSSLH